MLITSGPPCKDPGFWNLNIHIDTVYILHVKHVSMIGLLLTAVVAWLCMNESCAVVEGVYRCSAEWMLTVFAVLPLLLLFCLCGGAGVAGDFKTMPFETREHLIAYNTEGQGEDKVCDYSTRQNFNRDWFWRFRIRYYKTCHIFQRPFLSSFSIAYCVLKSRS